ncbi:MAG TPA: hypothetical protein VEW48_07080 [Thermoanaerobaculia bacterium]|nr:hypothetical protein [Thermoanaerobaculia bacterium]
MSTSVAASNGHSSNKGSNLRSWRIAVFTGIGALYLLSLFVLPLREALAKVFSYFPQ